MHLGISSMVERWKVLGENGPTTEQSYTSQETEICFGLQGTAESSNQSLPGELFCSSLADQEDGVVAGCSDCSLWRRMTLESNKAKVSETNVPRLPLSPRTRALRAERLMSLRYQVLAALVFGLVSNSIAGGYFTLVLRCWADIKCQE